MFEQNNTVGDTTIKIKEEKIICDIKSEMVEIEVKCEPYYYANGETDLYENNATEEEMVTGPVFQKYVGSEDATQPTDLLLEIKKTDASNPQGDTAQENVTKEIITIKIETDNWTDIQRKEIVENQSDIRSDNQEKDININFNNVFICNSCGELFDKKYTLIKHIECHEKKQKVYINCEECSYQTVTQDSLDRHVKLHDKNRRFVCDVCGYRYKKKYRLDTHKNAVHADIKIYRCSICDYGTNEKCVLKRHVMVHSTEKIFSCTECDYKCRYKNNLTNHIKKHTGEKKFSCSLCDYKSVQRGHLKRHVRTHTGEKLYNCTICNYKCIQKYTLKRHLLTHTGEKMFNCSVCDYKCSQKYSLTIHMKSHTGENQFSCTFCNYKCNQRSQLTRHVLTHTGEKSFKCTVCNYKCSQKYHLTRHLLTHNGPKVFSCSVCNYKCKQKHHLKRHERTHEIFLAVHGPDARISQ